MILDSPDYQDVEAVYRGSRTLVYRGIRKSDRQPVIIKILRNPNPTFNELVQFRHQYTITRNLRHPHIMEPLALERYGNGYALIMPDLEQCSLLEYWKSGNRLLHDFLQISIQLTQALHYLHQNHIIHKDIKPANILIHPQTHHIRLIDFSIASLLPKEHQQLINPQVLEGTLAYVSPEQTGRMNRGIDYRTDFYSLGVTFWELLTGELPFHSTDPMELVHCHIAKIPNISAIKKTQFTQEIPQVIADIILKLMAKNADDRYQSALGLQYDLEHCQQQLEERGTISPFPIAQRDICDRFIIPETLYGRKNAIKTLLETFDRISKQHTEMMLVSGFSGIGKTAVINEVHKPITRQNGYFIKGKFDQFNRHLPLSAFVQALRDLMNQILSESDAQIQQWKNQILQAVGDNGLVLIDVIPELEKIIGQQPSVPELSGVAAQNRFNLLFEKFIAIFSNINHPLVIVLDDLQWVDSASLQLIKTLMNSQLHLLLLGAYRDNEVSPIHPFILMVEQLKSQGKTITTLTLEPLSFADLNQWVADTLQCSLERSYPLTTLIERKTKGNPFFTTQFLKTLHEDGYIQFNHHQGYWQANLGAINQLSLTDDVVEFMSAKLKKFPTEIQNILKIASCIGHSFDIPTLVIVTDHLNLETLPILWTIVQEGLIVLPDQSYKFYVTLNSPENQDNSLNSIDRNSLGYCRFLHDRVQQAAYNLIPDIEKPQIHYQIGQLLLEKTPPEQRREHIFEIVNQLNYGAALVTEPDRKQELAQLNLIACHKARSGAAHQATRNYAEIGLSLLGDRGWKTNYKTTLSLHEFAAEAAATLSEFDQMNQWINQVIFNTEQWLDQLDCHLIKIQALTSQSLLLEAISYGDNLLQNLGIFLPQEVTPEILEYQIEVINQIIGDRTLEDLLKLPPMVDVQKLALMKIAIRMIPACYLANSPFFPLLACLQVKLSLQYGNGVLSSTGYADYGIFILTFKKDVRRSNMFSQLAYQLACQEKDKNIPAVTFVPVGLYLYHYKFHLQESLLIFQAGYQAALEVGKVEYVGHHSQGLCVNSYWSGQSLVDLEVQVQAYVQMTRNLKLALSEKYCTVIWEAILFLLGKPSKIKLTSGEDESDHINFNESFDANDKTGNLYFYLHRATLAFILNNMILAQADIEQAKQYLPGGIASICEAGYYFYDSLILLSTCSESSADCQQKLEQVKNNQEHLKLWSSYAPMNFLHKWQLVEAEKYRVLGQNYQAGDFYDRSISGAREQGYLQEEALGNELAAKFYLHWGREKVASGYMQEAYYSYSRWGAKVKTEELEANYSQLLHLILESPSVPSETNPDQINLTHNSLNTISTTTPLFDLISVIKASRIISESIELNTLLSKLMSIVLENGGADTGGLILNQSERWEVVAYCREAMCQIVSVSLEETYWFPKTIINRVKRTEKILIINSMKPEKSLVKDPYFREHSPKSLCCLPMLNQNKLMGILYLENSFSENAFTQEHMDTLNLLTAQAAICIENARLYQRLEDYNRTLENKVSQRTEELEQKNRDLQHTLKELQVTQGQLIHSEKMSSLGQMVAGIAHEINNPISFIAGNISHARDYLQTLFEVLKFYEEDHPYPSEILKAKLEESDLPFLEEDFDKILMSMKVGSDRIHKIIRGLRNFARLDESEFKEVDIHEGLENTLMILQHRLHRSEDCQEIQVVKTYGESSLVYCYASQLNQVFLHILTNAIDVLVTAKMNRAPEIRIKTEVVNEQMVRISIADNGPGIPESDRQKVFDPFFTTKPVGQGTGLGLSMSYQIITEQHHGKLHCYSELGQGTEFVIEIPIHCC